MNAPRNFDREMLSAIAGLKGRPSLLLHVCCAPCASQVLEQLEAYFDITCYYFNPNISPRAEYDARLREVERLLSEMPLRRRIPLIAEGYDPDPFFSAAEGLESEPEGGKRCEACFRLRLQRSARSAVLSGCEYYATSLTNGPMKNARLINAIGEEYALGVKWLPNDFKKRGGFLRSCELSRTYSLYRQDYCGCVFSQAARQVQTDR